LVLDARAGHQHAGQEAGRHRADREPDRVLLRDAGGAARAALDLLAVRRRLTHLAGRHADPLLHPSDGLADAVLRALLHVGLVAERVDRLSHLLTGLRYLVADRVRVLAHATSSFTLSMVSSGAGGVAARMRSRPRNASGAAIAA